MENVIKNGTHGICIIENKRLLTWNLRSHCVNVWMLYNCIIILSICYNSSEQVNSITMGIFWTNVTQRISFAEVWLSRLAQQSFPWVLGKCLKLCILPNPLHAVHDLPHFWFYTLQLLWMKHSCWTTQEFIIDCVPKSSLI